MSITSPPPCRPHAHTLYVPATHPLPTSLYPPTYPPRTFQPRKVIDRRADPQPHPRREPKYGRLRNRRPNPLVVLLAHALPQAADARSRAQDVGQSCAAKRLVELRRERGVALERGVDRLQVGRLQHRIK